MRQCSPRSRHAPGRRSVAVLLDEPLLVVLVHGLEQREAQLLDGGEVANPQQLLLQRPDESFGVTIALRLSDEGGGAATYRRLPPTVAVRKANGVRPSRSILRALDRLAEPQRVGRVPLRLDHYLGPTRQRRNIPRFVRHCILSLVSRSLHMNRCRSRRI